MVHFRYDTNFPLFRTCDCFLSCTYDNLRLSPIFLHNLRNVFLCFSEVMLRGLIFCAFWIERSRRISCSSFSALQTTRANHHLFCRFFQRFILLLLVALAESIHICRKTFLLHCVLCKFRTASFLSMNRKSTQLRCAFVYLRICC